MGRPLLRWLPAIVIAVTVLYTLSVYPMLPARMPSHWGINGQPNGWSPREFGAWLLPAMMVFLSLIFLAVPRKIGVAVDVVVSAIVTFEATIQYAMLSVAQGHAMDITTVVYASLGALFAILGFAMPKASGLLMVASGVVTFIAALTAPPTVAFTVLVASSVVAAFGSVLVASWRNR